MTPKLLIDEASHKEWKARFIENCARLGYCPELREVQDKIIELRIRQMAEHIRNSPPYDSESHGSSGLQSTG